MTGLLTLGLTGLLAQGPCEPEFLEPDESILARYEMNHDGSYDSVAYAGRLAGPAGTELLAVATQRHRIGQPPTPGAFTVFRGPQGSGLDVEIEFRAEEEELLVVDATSGDYDGDGDDDVFLLTADGPAWLERGPKGLRLSQFLSKDDTKVEGHAALTGDVDGDGLADILVLDTLGYYVLTAGESSTGLFSVTPGRVDGWHPGSAKNTALQDLDGDGLLDLALMRRRGDSPTLEVLYGKVGGFNAPVVTALGDLIDGRIRRAPDGIGALAFVAERTGEKNRSTTVRCLAIGDSVTERSKLLLRGFQGRCVEALLAGDDPDEYHVVVGSLGPDAARYTVYEESGFTEPGMLTSQSLRNLDWMDSLVRWRQSRSGSESLFAIRPTRYVRQVDLPWQASTIPESDNARRHPAAGIPEVTPRRYIDEPGVVIREDGIPESLRHLLPLAKIWCIGDDLERNQSISEATRAQLTELVESVSPHFDALAAWSTRERNNHPVPDEVILMDGLALAAAEALAELRADDSR